MSWVLRGQIKKFSSNVPSKDILLQCQKFNFTRDFISGKKIADQTKLGCAKYYRDSIGLIKKQKTSMLSVHHFILKWLFPWFPEMYVILI